MAEKIVKDSQGLAKDLVNDCISRKAAIDAICRDGVRLERGGALMITISTAKQWAVDLLCDLPSAQPETADCIYCHEDSDGYVKPIEKNCHAFIRFGMNGWEISLSAKGWNGSAKIMYCPMCGRRLSE